MEIIPSLIPTIPYSSPSAQEAPAHMPQVKRSLSVIYAANPFGADHESSEHDPAYKAYPERMEQIGLTNPQERLALNEEMMRFAMVTSRPSTYTNYFHNLTLFYFS